MSSSLSLSRLGRGLALCALSCGMLMLLTACGGRSPNTTYYVLDSGEASPVAALDKISENAKASLPRMQLRRVDMPGYLDRNALVTRESDGVRLNLAEFQSWAEPLGTGAQRVLGEVLTPLLLAQGVLLQPVDDDVRGPLQIFVQVQRMDGPLQGDIILDARWTVRDSDDKTITRGAFVDTEPAHGTYAGLAQAQSQLLKRLGNSMAEAIVKAVKTRK